jgi:hypothetical protein
MVESRPHKTRHSWPPPPPSPLRPHLFKHPSPLIPNNPKGVVGYVLSGPAGQVVSATLAPPLAQAYSQEMAALGACARAACRDLDPRDDLAFLRLRAARHEIAVASS